MAPHRLHLLQARLQARLQSEGYSGFAELERELHQPATRVHAVQMLIDLSTVNHTAFFREMRTLRAVVDQLACRLLEGRSPIRIWSAGCSSGQEPYSVLMLLAEAVGPLTAQQVQFWGTDLSREVLETAARAVYPERELTDVSPQRLKRFFLRGRAGKLGTYRIAPELRGLMTWSLLDLSAATWNVPEQFDAILCRNVLIYFEEQERLRLLDRLAERLVPGGWLVMGRGEILPARPGLLERVAPAIFCKVAT
jgi:chemotaxis protein methyltransferase CheR